MGYIAGFSRIVGSPPRVRGKAANGSSWGNQMGITPACAGKSLRSHLRETVHRDHPRVCGEKVAALCVEPLVQGSPPRVRGKDTVTSHDREAVGITPACAGKRYGHESRPGSRGDHPRVCGEKLHKSRTSSPSRGSPPRVRGKDPLQQHGRAYSGITPACAGKSFAFVIIIYTI